MMYKALWERRHDTFQGMARPQYDFSIMLERGGSKRGSWRSKSGVNNEESCVPCEGICAAFPRAKRSVI